MFEIKDYIIAVLVIIIILMFVCIYTISGKYKDFKSIGGMSNMSLYEVPVKYKNIKIMNNGMKTYVYTSTMGGISMTE